MAKAIEKEKTHSGAANLHPPRTKAEARERGRNGGIASGAARREKRTMRRWAELMRDMAPPKWAAKLGETNAGAAVASMYAEAMRGNVSAFRALVEVMGEMDTPPAIEVHSPFVLGVIPPEMVKKAEAVRRARQLADMRV